MSEEQNKNQTPEAVELRSVLTTKDEAAQADQKATGSVKSQVVSMYSNGWTKEEVESAAGWTEENASEAEKATAKRFTQYAREITSRLSNEEREEIATAIDSPVADLEEQIGVKGTKKETETSLRSWQVKSIDAWVKIIDSLMRGIYTPVPTFIMLFINKADWHKLTNQKEGENNQGMELDAAKSVVNEFTTGVGRHIPYSNIAKKIRDEKTAAAKATRLEDRVRTATENVPLDNLKASAKAQEEIELPKKATREDVVDALATNARVLEQFEKPSESGLARDWKAAKAAAKAAK